MTFHRSYLALAAAALLLAASSMSQAADKQAPAAASSAPAWTGVHAGLFAGYGWGRARSTSPYDSSSGFYYNWTGNNYSANPAGFCGGGILGVNRQSRRLVFGLEGEVGYMRLQGSAIDPNHEPGTAPIPDTVTRFESGAYAAAYGRLGIHAGSLLLYGKGGGALLRAEATTIDPCANAPGCGTTTLTMTGRKTMPGWSAGGGIEWRLALNWSAKTEYAYYDFGSIDTAGPSSVAGEYYNQSIVVTSHAVKFGLSYRF